jgi:hypothetical protein
LTDCLNDYGWSRPKRIPDVQPYQPFEPLEVPERPCEECGKVGRHGSRHNHRLVCHLCLCRASNVLGVGLPTEPPSEPSQPAPAYEEPRCPTCHLVLCGCPRPAIFDGGPRPVHLLHHELLPRLQDIEYWQREIDADKARREVANARIDENCPESRILQEIARRQLSGETF